MSFLERPVVLLKIYCKNSAFVSRLKQQFTATTLETPEANRNVTLLEFSFATDIALIVVSIKKKP